MTRVRFAARLAWRALAASKAVSVLVAVLLAPPIVLMLYMQPSPRSSPRLTVPNLIAIPLVMIVVRSVLATRRRTLGRRGALLTLNGARPADVVATEIFESVLFILGGTVFAAFALAAYMVGFRSDPNRHMDVLAGAKAAPVVFAGLALAAAVTALPFRRVLRSGRVRVDLAVARPSSPTRPLTYFTAVAAVVLGLVGLMVATDTTDDADTWLALASLLTIAVGVGLLGSCALGLLEPLSRNRRGIWLMAGRTMARHRYRTAPLLAVATVFVGIAVVAGAGFLSNEQADALRTAERDRYVSRTVPGGVVALRDGQPFALANPKLPVSGEVRAEIVETVRSATGTDPVPVPIIGDFDRSLRITSSKDEMARSAPESIGIAGPAVLQALHLDPYQADLDAGRVLALNPLAVTDLGSGHPAVRFGRWNDEDLTIDATVVYVDRIHTALPAVLVSEAFAAAHHLEPFTHTMLYAVPDPLPAGVRDAILAASTERLDVPLGVYSYTVEAPEGDRLIFDAGHQAKVTLPGAAGPLFSMWDLDLWPLAVAADADAEVDFVIMAIVVMAATLALAVALGTSQRRGDDELLALQGAPAGVRRRLSAIEAGVLTALAGVLASTVGAGVSLAAIRWTNLPRSAFHSQQLSYVQPWNLTILLVVVMPLILAAGAYLLTPPIRHIDVSRLASDG